MLTSWKRIFFVLFLFFRSINIFASNDVMEHILDSHEWHITTINKHHITIPLPIILLSTDRGLEYFLSSKFKDENHNLISYQGYVLESSKIKPLDKDRIVIDLSITKNIASMLISIVILLNIFLYIGFWYKRHDYKATPKGFVALMEMLILYVRNDIAIPNIGEKKADKYTPYLLTIFFFIWLNNIMGLLPGSANVTGSASITFALAFATFVVTSLNGTKHYWAHTFTPNVPKFLWPIMVPIEVIGLFTKPITLMLRLVANLSAGHIIILSIINFVFILGNEYVGIGSVIMGSFMIILKLLVCFLQAYIFTLLSSIYIGSAVH